MIAKPKKKPSKAALKKKCDTLASQYYRDLTPRCELAGLDGINCGGGLQWCHIYTRSILHMRYEPYNNLVCCQGHHTYYTHNPIDWVRTLEQHYPERLALAEFNRYKYGKVDYQHFIDLFANLPDSHL